MIRAKIQRSTGSRVLGFVLAALLAAGLMLAAKPAHADTAFTVTNTNDSGAGSLRQAITDANNTPGADTINFNISGTGVKTISPTSELPPITDAVTIDGYTQPGSSPNTLEQGATNAVLNIQLDGTSARANAQGLVIEADNVVVRGLVINNFDLSGIVLIANSRNSTIQGNFIGTDPTGTRDLGNGLGGVDAISGNNTIGGASPASRNLISGNDLGGIKLFGSANRVEGNLIGTSKDGTSPLGNKGVDGVSIESGDDNFVGGFSSGSANTIAFNEENGVRVSDSGNSGNRILTNSIFSNGEEGIDLGPDGPTANDPRDADTGPNNLQNFPALTSAKTSRAGTTIKGTLKSTPNANFTVQLFSNPEGEDEGKTFLGETTATTNKKGKASFSLAATLPVGTSNVTATATDSKGNTSEFSDPKTVVD